jgi:hypothetical protein
VRTSSLVAAAALIAAAALVSTAVPAQTRVTGQTQQLDGGVFARLVPPLAPGAATTAPTLDPAARARGVLPLDEPLLDPGKPDVPADRPTARQPRAAVRVVVKPTPTPRPTARPKPRPEPAAPGGGGGGWRRAEYSWYGPGFYGNGTACGQTYSRTILGTAHKTLPCGTRVTFRNPKNGRTITVRVIDRGPYVAGRLWDLSRATCVALDNCYTGLIQYRLP